MKTNRQTAIDAVIDDFSTSTLGDLVTILEDGAAAPGLVVEIESWILSLVDRAAAIQPDRLEKALIAMEAVARQRLAAANRACLEDPLSVGDLGCDVYGEMHGAQTAIRALIHVRLITATAHPDIGPAIIARARAHEKREADRLTHALAAALAVADRGDVTQLN